MEATVLTDQAHYTLGSVDADSYRVTGVTVPFFDGPTTVELSFTLTSGSVSQGDTIMLGQAIIDEAGNSIDPEANTLRADGFSPIIGGAP